jgi:hypothetical protein
MVRKQIIELSRLGPLPSSEVALRDHLDGLIAKYEDLLKSIQKPVTNEEARILVTLFSPGDAFGLDWALVHLVESAPGWPLLDCLKNANNEWIQLLRQTAKNSGMLPSSW